METSFLSELFWPLSILILFHLGSLAIMAVVLKMFSHVKRKQFALLSTFRLASCSGNATPLCKKGHRWILAYVILTAFYAATTILFLVFQPHVL